MCVVPDSNVPKLRTLLFDEKRITHIDSTAQSAFVLEVRFHTIHVRDTKGNAGSRSSHYSLVSLWSQPGDKYGRRHPETARPSYVVHLFPRRDRPDPAPATPRWRVAVALPPLDALLGTSSMQDVFRSGFVPMENSFVELVYGTFGRYRRMWRRRWMRWWRWRRASSLVKDESGAVHLVVCRGRRGASKVAVATIWWKLSSVPPEEAAEAADEGGGGALGVAGRGWWGGDG